MRYSKITVGASKRSKISLVDFSKSDNYCFYTKAILSSENNQTISPELTVA
jgi:hypothetical protein